MILIFSFSIFVTPSWQSLTPGSHYYPQYIFLLNETNLPSPLWTPTQAPSLPCFGFKSPHEATVVLCPHYVDALFRAFRLQYIIPTSPTRMPLLHGHFLSPWLGSDTPHWAAGPCPACPRDTLPTLPLTSCAGLMPPTHWPQLHPDTYIAYWQDWNRGSIGFSQLGIRWWHPQCLSICFSFSFIRHG